MASLINSCGEVMRHAAEKKQSALITEVSSAVPELLADKRACKQMLLNVISNAIKFTDAGGGSASRHGWRRTGWSSLWPTMGLALLSRTCPSSGIPSCRLTIPTTEAMTVPVLACRWSKGSRVCMAAGWRSQASWSRHHRYDRLAAGVSAERTETRPEAVARRHCGVSCFTEQTCATCGCGSPFSNSLASAAKMDSPGGVVGRPSVKNLFS